VPLKSNNASWLRGRKGSTRTSWHDHVDASLPPPLLDRHTQKSTDVRDGDARVADVTWAMTAGSSTITRSLDRLEKDEPSTLETTVT
jgi:hypothetical protein